MASQKHLKDLLQEDQEPFKLKSYISDRQCQIMRLLSPRTHLQVKKRKPISQNSSFPSNLCKKACFLSLHESPDPRKSPLFGFQSPNKSPNAIFLNIPARTAALLLEAAVRIQKQSSDNPKTKTQKGNGFGFLGSVLKKLTHRKKREIGGDGVNISVKDILRWDSPIVRRRFNGNVKSDKLSKSAFKKSAVETRSCNGRTSGAVWSESNEEKSLDCDLETPSSSGSRSDGLDKMDEIVSENGGDFGDFDKQFCESPFHFVLQTSPSPGRGTPNFSPRTQSPSRRRTENKEKYEVENLKGLQEDEEEEDKEQCSPVSVLDPPFQDDDDGHMDDYDDERSLDLESSFAIVQRAKHQLLQKLRRFEQLAGLDPIELEKRMSEEEHDEEQHCELIDELDSLDGEIFDTDELVEQILESNFDQLKQRIPEGMKRLVSDLISEEQNKIFCIEREGVAKRVCNRLDSWKEVESNTIDMMVERDYKQELGFWKKNQEQVQVAALEIEFAIFGYLVEELSDELVSD